MVNRFTRLLRRGLLPATVVAIAQLSSSGSAANDADPREFRGACYCRARSELLCEGNLTARECDLRSKLSLCDDWFWKERLACWNWGYGG